MHAHSSEIIEVDFRVMSSLSSALLNIIQKLKNSGAWLN